MRWGKINGDQRAPVAACAQRWLSCALACLLLPLILAACAGGGASRYSSSSATATVAALARLAIYVGNKAPCYEGCRTDGQGVVALDAATGAVQREYGDDASLGIASAPLAQDGVIYAATLQHELVAIGAGDGAVHWRRSLGLFSVFYAPVLADGLLLLTEERLSDQLAILGTRLEAFDAATGEPRWSRAGISGAWLSPPTVRDGVAYIALDGALSALRLRDGATLWRAAPPGGTNGRAAVADDGGLVYDIWQDAPAQATRSANGFLSGYVAALHTTDGSLAWRSGKLDEVAPGPDESPQVAEGVVYGAPRGRAFALDAATGRELWRYPDAAQASAPDAGVRGAALAGGTAYLSMYEGSYVALDARTGAERWHTGSLFDVDLGTAVTKRLTQDMPLVAGGLFFSEFAGAIAGGGSGAMVALDAGSGALRWHTPLKGALYPAFSLSPRA